MVLGSHKSVPDRFRAKFTSLVGPRLFKRFLEACRSYVNSVTNEAERRERNEILGTDAWIQARRPGR